MFVIRPVLGKMVMARLHDQEINTRCPVIVGTATIASGLARELMGLHYIVGAFVTGAVTPVPLRKPILERLYVMTVALLMPFFFTLTGLHTMIDPGSPVLIEVLTLTTTAATIEIIAGQRRQPASSERAGRSPWGLGSLLQAKGLTELIVPSVRLDAKVISVRIFSALILTALISTGIAMPLARQALSSGARRQPMGDSVALSGR